MARVTLFTAEAERQQCNQRSIAQAKKSTAMKGRTGSPNETAQIRGLARAEDTVRDRYHFSPLRPLVGTAHYGTRSGSSRFDQSIRSRRQSEIHREQPLPHPSHFSSTAHRHPSDRIDGNGRPTHRPAPTSDGARGLKCIEQRRRKQAFASEPRYRRRRRYVR